MLVIVLILLLPAAATAAVPGESSDSPSINQYVESVPTARDDKAVGAHDKSGPPLPPAARERLRREGGADAEALAEIATSPSLGAPDAPARSRDDARIPMGPSARPDGPSAASAVREASGGSAGWLVGGLAAMAACAGAAAVVRRRQTT